MSFPHDLVAIFHASFHPTQGNLVDWSLKASDDLNLDNIEFSVLPSGLHLVDRDVVYFNKDGQHGVCIFRRRKTQEEGQRGFRLSSLGVLLARSRRPRPWAHTAALKDLVQTIYDQCEAQDLLQPTEKQWELARTFFEQRKVQKADMDEWNGWIHELSEIPDPSSHPTLHLPHLLRILGPSSLTLYKHVLGRRRILIYTSPPVEAACILCYAAADMCYESQSHSQTPGASGSGSGSGLGSPPHRRTREPISVLGMVTLSDMDRLSRHVSGSGGWIACTTDAIFLEKPGYYDLLIDLTHAGARPAFYVSKPVVPPPPRGATHRLSLTRFAWSDIKLWNELDRIMRLGHAHDRCCDDGSGDPTTSRLGALWADTWRVYEDVCVVCAGLWMGLGSWRPAAINGNGGGGMSLEGEDDLGLGVLGGTASSRPRKGSGSGLGLGSGSGTGTGTGTGTYVRSLGMGIEGRPGPLASGSTTRAARRVSAMSWSSGRATVVGLPTSPSPASASAASVDELGVSIKQNAVEPGAAANPYRDHEGDEDERADRQLRTTLALLQTLHAHTSFQLATLASFVSQPQPGGASPSANTNGHAAAPGGTLYLTPKDMVQFELGPLSTSDARYLEWLAQEYAGDTKVVLRRSWRDLVGVLLGYA
ncbi:hypothetical protein H0H92_014869 [Tricholoma furcatifolium]|nr:hypothetical protein H0H92_014869 [Tricholoma furcatifolium]